MAKKKTNDEEVVNHFGAVRLRVTGLASLKMSLFSLDNVQQTVLVPISVINSNNIEPNRLCNFTQQRARLELRTTEIDEIFSISKIVVFTKPVAKSFPETS